MNRDEVADAGQGPAGTWSERVRAIDVTAERTASRIGLGTVARRAAAVPALADWLAEVAAVAERAGAQPAGAAGVPVPAGRPEHPPRLPAFALGDQVRVLAHDLVVALAPLGPDAVIDAPGGPLPAGALVAEAVRRMRDLP